MSKNNLALFYELGRGTPKNINEALRLYREAADTGHITAQYNLGYLLAYGEVLSPNYEEAARLFRLAADQGSETALSNRKALFHAGQGG